MLTGTGGSPHPDISGVTFQAGAGDVLEFDCIGSGTPTVASMTITVGGGVAALVPYALTNYTGQNFRVQIGGSFYSSTFLDGTRAF